MWVRQFPISRRGGKNFRPDPEPKVQGANQQRFSKQKCPAGSFPIRNDAQRLRWVASPQVVRCYRELPCRAFFLQGRWNSPLPMVVVSRPPNRHGRIETGESTRAPRTVDLDCAWTIDEPEQISVSNRAELPCHASLAKSSLRLARVRPPHGNSMDGFSSFKCS